ncbi:MAG: 3-isopropylmalate/(R)-2-methylmalate dehydratase small subunit [Acidobacteriota bacterium]|jgi:3-isopropylmalate/(R)-2-methylmalate dehydratase small subunit|nr:3-isopropylmalate/(R)-2-methylmalate dehydratase small subunit [Acidobacteriota bacterium]
MLPFRVHTGVAVPLDHPNVDTDQIIPKQFLKRVERTGFGQFLFYDWRYVADGSLDPAFVLNEPRYVGSTVLLAGSNFGCGSSREHAPWALLDYGFRAVVATSFADIFKNNCMKNGVLPVTLRDEKVAELVRRAREFEGYRLTVDLERCEVRDEQGFTAAFEIDEFRRQCLLEGLDDVGLTLRHEALIEQFEERRPVWLGVSTAVGR